MSTMYKIWDNTNKQYINNGEKDRYYMTKTAVKLSLRRLKELSRYKTIDFRIHIFETVFISGTLPQDL